MGRKYINSLLGIMLLLLASCIKNDIDYPVIKLQILDIAVEGQLGNAVINTETNTITLNLDESVNLKRVKVTKLEMTDHAKTDLAVHTVLDLTKPEKVTLSLYQDYEWTIVAQQPIERRFVVEDQIGAAVFDVKNRIAVAFVSTSTSLRTIQIEDLKLGPTGCTMTPSDYSTLHNFMSAQTITVKYHDVTEVWTLRVSPTTDEVVTVSADGWTNVAWLSGQGKKGAVFGFEICEASSEVWSAVNESYITVNGGTFTARVPHLKASTVYNCRAVSNGKYGATLTFTTGEPAKLPGGSFDDWHQVGKVWNPWAVGAQQVWDTGNKGATTLGDSNSVPTNSETWNGQGNAAKLFSKYVNFLGIGKFAAGNLYIGQYLATEGTNGRLQFGVPFSARPTRLKGHYKYTTAPINNLPNEKTAPLDYKRFVDYKNEPDTCAIYIALGDWSSPVEIYTKYDERKLFDKNDSHVIAYAEFNSGTTVTEYKELMLELNYRATNRIPTYLLVVCSASKYGDFFTGGEGATLWVDDFTLEYDYND